MAMLCSHSHRIVVSRGRIYASLQGKLTHIPGHPRRSTAGRGGKGFPIAHSCIGDGEAVGVLAIFNTTRIRF